MTVTAAGVTVDWLGYATTRIEWADGTVAYTDPGRYGVLTGEWTPGGFEGSHEHPPGAEYRAQDGDLVVITHAHHYDPHGIARVASADAAVVVYDAIDAATTSRDVTPVDALDYDVRRVEYGARQRAAGVALTVTEAQTAPDEPGGTSLHPPGVGCGYTLTRGDTTVFWPGASDALASHDAIDCDVLLAPISRRITMGETEAADLADRLDPALAVPIHYNTVERLAGDGRRFASAVASSGVPVALDEQASTARPSQRGARGGRCP
ncbi:MBL fold metallo-hydrolase [Halobacterium salinarum]|uniref:MBL fold metallo-hydrolase n=1 Tax=Halobacterium salinarum TaxID=2242 RepID=UPI001F42C903|nr:MBL fold metallo-hydrolase [Halobacterium salinarum]MCF2238508.1 MBL fold metallo-hydrolase [Halobacterium salinarum]